MAVEQIPAAISILAGHQGSQPEQGAQLQLPRQLQEREVVGKFSFRTRLYRCLWSRPDFSN
ncbi:hypothetical protein QOT17_020154 [Balamuthia mandrillaris]